MKAADAKAPKFDSKWWKANKAKLADLDGGFERALARYEAERDHLIAALGPSSTAANPAAVGAALLEVKKQAAKRKTDAKLAAGGKETKDALAAYEQAADLALKHFKRVTSGPLYTSGPKELVIDYASQFSKYCRKRYVEENFDFLSAVAKGQRNAATYTKFIRAGSDSQVNIDHGLRGEFDAIASGPDADNPAAWRKAPWGRVVVELELLFNHGIMAGWRIYLLDATLKPNLP